MFQIRFFCISLSALAFLFANQPAYSDTNGRNTTLYTSIAEIKCRDLPVDKLDDEQSYLAECPGAGGYKLRHGEDDMRQSLDVVAPDGKAHPLDLYGVVSAAPSHLGDTVEWRGVGKAKKFHPHALIFRSVAQTDPEHGRKQRSQLVVAKISQDEICVTDILPATDRANEMARTLADRASGKPCLQTAR